MSEKKAKEKRREEAEAKKPIGHVVIDVYNDGTVDVRGFPQDHGAAMGILLNALMNVSHYFTLPPPEPSKIIVANPAASPADIIQMARGIR
jgi:hypothetical protein